MAINQVLKISISNKPVDFKIVESPALFRDKHYQGVSYRLVVLHAMQHYFLKKGSKSALALLNELQKGTQHPNDGYYEPSFLELYTFNKMKKTGLIMIDRSKGCFPLALYPNDENPKHGSRIWTFEQMLADLLLSHAKYDELLKKRTEWEITLVDQLRSTFTFPEKNQQDNTFIDSGSKAS